ncbi:3-deoxy-D-manno-octulosonic acid transferase [Rickettsiales endosymbiont of Stachyamoeba lipophora]|uniref:3-deoxy-D-manno-octulosonic acid transferase n=1 Tax=Rickettsiales endosymbiont of Stachyamoeba lipophora TaxID=2486578 RepID=UPI000F654D94|nr:3-deoxy-D-manno-octulosonic acid transferase [Rickettsiales endosymbiont of Stachyamoeba lipophora]AZL15499.1 3-deoxy-D-manno-octulosonic acid transferase [Rickettsiales endosymbiont of Stachyamoeba lipophora]
MILLIKLYKLITWLVEPFARFHLMNRVKKGKEIPSRYLEKLGVTNIQRPQGKLVWIHAASVGESLSALKLVEILLKEQEYQVLFTSCTKGSADILKDKLPAPAIHQFAPLDLPQALNKFLTHWQPNIVIIFESEIWPNLVFKVAKTIPIFLLNARLSDKSFAKWLKVKAIAKLVMSKYKFILPQSKVDYDKFANFSDKLHYLGNLKVDSALTTNSQMVAKLEKSLHGRPNWAAVSTHSYQDEEIIVLKAHLSLLTSQPGLLLILAPRHPSRLSDVIALCTRFSLTYELHTKTQGQISEHTQVYIIDTVGELGNIFKTSKIVFVGGSFNHINGHNPIEPAHFGCAIVTGPKFTNFTNIYNDLFEHKAALKIANQQELIDTLAELLLNPSKCNDLGNNALKLISNNSNLSEQAWQFIKSQAT